MHLAVGFFLARKKINESKFSNIYIYIYLLRLSRFFTNVWSSEFVCFGGLIFFLIPSERKWVFLDV